MSDRSNQYRQGVRRHLPRTTEAGVREKVQCHQSQCFDQNLFYYILTDCIGGGENGVFLVSLVVRDPPTSELGVPTLEQ